MTAGNQMNEEPPIFATQDGRGWRPPARPVRSSKPSRDALVRTQNHRNLRHSIVLVEVWQALRWIDRWSELPGTAG